MQIKGSAIFLLSMSVFFLNSCGIKLKGAKHGVGGAVETFLVEGGTTQYFVKPLSFKSPQKRLTLDITLRSITSDTFKAKINFSVNEGFPAIDSFTVSDHQAGNLLSVTPTRPIHISKHKRYFSTASNAIVNELLKRNREFEIILFSQGKPETFSPERRTIKKLRTVASAIK